MRFVIDHTRQLAYLEGDSHLSEWVREAGIPDAYRDPVCQHNCAHLRPGQWVVDAGGALGDHTAMYLKVVGLAGRVIAFEPNREFFDCLRYNCPHATCINAALWDQSGLQKLYTQKDGNAGAFHMGDHEPQVRNVMVKTMALDDLDLQRLDFYKLDIEGAELMALRGSVKTIQRCRPLIQCEVVTRFLTRCGHTEAELEAFFVEQEYVVKDISIHGADGSFREILATPIQR